MVRSAAGLDFTGGRPSQLYPSSACALYISPSIQPNSALPEELTPKKPRLWHGGNPEGTLEAGMKF